jgi:ectoine hydroxylase-related dioxygenase (phytanoyl-CoA dioxygenase family)
MNIDTKTQGGYYDPDMCDLEEFSALVSRTTDSIDIPNATSAPDNIPVYEIGSIGHQLTDKEKRRELMAEWAHILQSGAGVLVIKGAQPDHQAIDDATEVYNQIIDKEKVENGGGADHFAAAGSNDRIWNSLQKLCDAAPDTFIRYFASAAIDAVCEAWLGPNYQMTAQVNLVHPGGQAQQAHRDYHLGFQTAEVSGSYPSHVHDLSPLMTLQAGIAHDEMPLESGPTKLLPFSQLYRPGYAAWRRDDFRCYFEEHHVQLALNKGDTVFFNPALFHAAGENKSSDIHRLVNLLQVSSAFGRAMESVDRLKMCKAIYQPLCTAWNTKIFSEAQLDAVIAATGEGYSFPTNLDRDPPINGLAPKSQQALLKEHVLSPQDPSGFFQQLDEQANRQIA